MSQGGAERKVGEGLLRSHLGKPSGKGKVFCASHLGRSYALGKRWHSLGYVHTSANNTKNRSKTSPGTIYAVLYLEQISL